MTNERLTMGVADSLSEQIADDLFTNGMNETALRLVMEMPDGKDGGGWCRDAVVSRVRTILAGAVGTLQAYEILDAGGHVHR